jgi:hypothetical protein
MKNEALLAWLDWLEKHLADTCAPIGAIAGNALAQLRLMLKEKKDGDISFEFATSEQMKKIVVTNPAFINITGNESLMRLAEKLGVEFSAAKIIRDTGYAEGRADYEPKEPTDEERKEMTDIVEAFIGTRGEIRFRGGCYNAKKLTDKIRAIIKARKPSVKIERSSFNGSVMFFFKCPQGILLPKAVAEELILGLELIGAEVKE